MRVQCEQCAVTYSVADDKVSGRKLKQKCRKCGAQMLIDGTALGHDHTPMAIPQGAQERGMEADQAVWHIALGDTAQGPYTLEELAQYYADGSVVLDTLVCRDGWNDWKPAGEVSELLESSRGPALVSVTPPARAAVAFAAPSFTEPVTMGRDPFGESMVDAGPRVSLEEMQQTGAQRDGTVQFSMDQIRALSSVSAPSVPAPAPVTAGHASRDGSGLIDMRALAEAEVKAAAEAAQAALSPAASNDGFRALRPSAIGPVHGLSPLTLVGGEASQGLDFRTKVMASLAAFTAVLAAAVAIVVVLRDDPQVTAAAPSVAAAAAPSVAAAAAPSVAVAAAPSPPATALAAAVVPNAAALADDAPESSDSDDEHEVDQDERRDSRKRASRGNRKARSSEERPSAKASGGNGLDDVLAKADAPKKSSSVGASIDDLLDGAINGKRSAPKEEPREPSSTLPKAPSREDMLSAFGRAKGKMSGCKGPGVATATIMVSGKTGKASSVTVAGVEGAARACVEKAVRSTSFPKFQNDNLKVQFPFKLGA